MKKIILLSILCVSVLKGYPQYPNYHDGLHHINGNDLKAGNVLHPDSSGGLAQSYILEDVCGLNWEQSSVLTETRYGPPFVGTGLPCTVPLTFDSCSNLDSVVTAFLYFNGSYQTPYAANPASVSITNPVSQVFTYLADSIGTGPPKCWGETGTIAYRVNITNCIKGGGNYIVNLSGTGITSWGIDGTTILVIYIDKSAAYSGSIVLWDGLYSAETGSKSQTFSGFNVCTATSSGQAFSILADMQQPINTETYNGSSGTFWGSFYNFCSLTTSLTAGQTSTTYSVYTNNGLDCYSWVLAGLYWQNTNCKTCIPSVTGTLPVNITPQKDTICLEDTVQLTASGANTYIWNPPTGLSCNNCPNPKASPNATTIYTVTGFDGCTFGKDTMQIVVSPVTTPTVIPGRPQICSSDSVQLTVLGGANYVWKPAVGLSCYACSNPVASPSGTTTYTLFSGLDGCKDSTLVTVDVTPTPTVSIVPQSPAICAGGSVKLTASGAGTYNWFPGAGLSCSFCSSPIASPTVTTVYTITGINGSCLDRVTDTVFVMPTPVATVTPKFDSVCQGDSVLLTGSGGNIFTWSNGKTTSSIVVAPMKTTIYTLAVSNGACSDSTTVTVKITSKITALREIDDSVVCPHDSTHLLIIASGGSATYKWSTGATTSSITVNDTATTMYTVTAYGLCDSVQKSFTVTVVPLAKPVIMGTKSKCMGQDDTLTVTNPVNPATYHWSNGKTTTTIVTGAINADSTIYVTAYNSLGCPVADTFHILAIPYPSANITYPPGCGTNITTINANAKGVGNINYKWNTGGTNDTIDVYINSDTTFYNVAISNDGCTVTKTVTVVKDFPPLSACCNTRLLAGGDTTITANGANIVSYKWIPDTALNCDTCATVIANPTATTTYTVIGTDAQGCQSERTVTIIVDIPCFNLTVPNVFTPSNGGVLGLDKVFYIKTENIDGWSLSIYDRWGREMYSSNNPNQYWDGNTQNGEVASAGVYYYVITGTCQNITYKRVGFVQLIR